MTIGIPRKEFGRGGGGAVLHRTRDQHAQISGNGYCVAYIINENDKSIIASMPLSMNCGEQLSIFGTEKVSLP